MTDTAVAPTRLAPHGHAVVFGRGRTALAAAAVEVFDAARDSGEAFMLVSDDADPQALAPLEGRDEMLASGRLRVVRTADAYPHRDAARLFAGWDADLRATLAAGWNGIRIVADNTSLARGDDGAFDDWLRWEHTTSRWQAANPVVGACWFDVDVIGADRAAQLASIHPETFGHDRRPAFRLVADDDAVRLTGDVDSHEVRRVTALLTHVPASGVLTLDLADAGYVHHTLLAALETTAPSVERIRVVGARQVLHRVWAVVGDTADRVELV